MSRAVVQLIGIKKGIKIGNNSHFGEYCFIGAAGGVKVFCSVSFVLPFMPHVQTVSGTFSRDFSQHSDIGSSDVHWRSSIVLFWCQSE